MDESRIETTQGMIGDLITRGRRRQEAASLKGDQGRCKCQAFQLIWVFGTDRLSSGRAGTKMLLIYLYAEGLWCINRFYPSGNLRTGLGKFFKIATLKPIKLVISLG